MDIMEDSHRSLNISRPVVADESPFEILIRRSSLETGFEIKNFSILLMRTHYDPDLAQEIARLHAQKDFYG